MTLWDNARQQAYIGAGWRTALTTFVVRDPCQVGGVASNSLYCGYTADLERVEIVWRDARVIPTCRLLDDDRQ